ncbi:MAG: VOC family protein [Acidimicrobiales bacterium]|jgi:hypothetical protein|nr:VOC family protein [Acidimicrobiales bacterium]
MAIRLRQVALVAHDLDAVEEDLIAELGLEPCVRDLGVSQFGLRNVLFPVGERLLEVVSPVETGTTAGRQLARRNGDGGYMVLVQTDDLVGDRERLDTLGVRVVLEASMPGIEGVHLHPKDVGGAILSIDETVDWLDWPWAGSTWRDHVRTDVVSDLVAVEIQAHDPAIMAERWAAVLGVGRSGSVVLLDEGEIRFVEATDGRGDGVSGLGFRSDRSADLEIGGVRVALRPQ